MSKYKFVNRNASWFKRRSPNPKEPKVTKVEVVGFKLEKYHSCHMIATYDNGDVIKRIAQVIQNHITKKWTVSCGHVIMDVIEE